MATYESRRYNTPVPDVTKIADGSVNNTEFETLDGVTSDIQTQLNAKLNLAGGALTGALSTNSNISLSDSNHIYVGTGQDIDIVSDGSAGYIRANDLRLTSSTDENYVTSAINGATNLWYDNSNKLQTTSSGVSVTGTMAATTVTGNGSGLTALNGSNISSGTIPSARVSGIARAINSTTTLNVVPPTVPSTSGTAPTFSGGTSQSGASVTIDVTNIDRVVFDYGMESWVASAFTDQNYCTSFTSAQIRILRSGSGSAYLPSEDGLLLNDEFFTTFGVNPVKLYQRKNQIYNFVYEEDVSGLSGNVTYTNDIRGVAYVNVSGAYSSSPQSFTGRGQNLATIQIYSNWLKVVGH
jgi:hypothetical protein